MLNVCAFIRMEFLRSGVKRLFVTERLMVHLGLGRLMWGLHWLESVGFRFWAKDFCY